MTSPAPDSIIKPVTWWAWLWGAIMVALLISLFFLPFRWWSIAALVLFGTMEGIGTYNTHHAIDQYPPLTDLIRKYVKAWIAIPAMWALAALAGWYWHAWHSPYWTAALVGLLGWFNTHFDGKYDKK